MMKHRIFALLTALALTCSLSVCASAASFSDVSRYHWARESIYRCSDLGFFRGESEDAFGLGKPMTRAAFVTVLGRFFDWAPASAPRIPFTDVSPDAWYASAVAAAYESGAITTQHSLFRPNDPITREEMAVMLVRALGYTSISGLAGDHPFTDVGANGGYIAMAYEMGLVTGTSDTTFDPASPATREQTAVILMRLYDKLNAPLPSVATLLRSWPKEGMDLTGYDVVALDAAQLSTSSKRLGWTENMSKKERTSAMDSARAAGAKVLLYASGKASTLKTTPANAADRLWEEVKKGGYDGLYLELTDVPVKYRDDFTALVQAAAQAMEDKLFYLAVPGETAQEDGYDRSALSAAADRLVLRTAFPSQATSAPPQSPEVLYAAVVPFADGENLSVILDAQGARWRGGRQLSAPSVEDALAAIGDDLPLYDSARFGASYRLLEDGSILWYPDGRSATAQLQLLRLLGVDHICIENPHEALAEMTAVFGIG